MKPHCRQYNLKFSVVRGGPDRRPIPGGQYFRTAAGAEKSTWPGNGPAPGPYIRMEQGLWLCSCWEQLYVNCGRYLVIQLKWVCKTISDSCLISNAILLLNTIILFILNMTLRLQEIIFWLRRIIFYDAFIVVNNIVQNLKIFL